MATAEELVRRAERVAGELLADQREREARDRRTFELAYRAGFAAGYDVGRAHEANEMADAWHRVAEWVRSFANTPTLAELNVRRRQGAA